MLKRKKGKQDFKINNHLRKFKMRVNMNSILKKHTKKNMED